MPWHQQVSLTWASQPPCDSLVKFYHILLSTLLSLSMVSCLVRIVFVTWRASSATTVGMPTNSCIRIRLPSINFLFRAVYTYPSAFTGDVGQQQNSRLYNNSICIYIFFIIKYFKVVLIRRILINLQL